MIDPSTFRSVLGRFASGVTVVTARDDAGTDHGMTVSAFCSVSLQPPLILICVEHASVMFGVLKVGSWIGVNVLSAPQEALSRRFAEKDNDRFDGIGYSRGQSGVAILDDVLAWLECRIIAAHEHGDHTVFIAEVEEASPRDARPLLYYRGGYALLER